MEILKFYADWCGPCKTLAKIIESNNIKVTNINVDSDGSEDLIEKYNIKNLPTLVKIDTNGNEVDRLFGIPGSEKLKEFCV